MWRDSEAGGSQGQFGLQILQDKDGKKIYIILGDAHVCIGQKSALGIVFCNSSPHFLRQDVSH